MTQSALCPHPPPPPHPQASDPSRVTRLLDAFAHYCRSGQPREEAPPEVQSFLELARAQRLLHISEVPREALDLVREHGVPAAFQGCHYLLDEFQDTDAVQFELLLRLASDQTECRLTLVGDPDQAIYGFRGANSQLMCCLQVRPAP